MKSARQLLLLPALFLPACVGIDSHASTAGGATARGPATESGSEAISKQTFQDQFGRSWPLSPLLEGPCILVLGSPDTAESSTRWDVEVISPALRSVTVPVFRVLDVSGVPRLFSPIVRARLRDNVRPPGTPILLDWEGRLHRLLAAARDRTTVLVLDGSGGEIFRAEGEPDPESSAALERAVAIAGGR